MSKLTMAQNVAKVIGKKGGRNTYFSSDIHDPDNVCIKTAKDVAKSLGVVDKADLLNIVKTRLGLR